MVLHSDITDKLALFPGLQFCDCLLCSCMLHIHTVLNMDGKYCKRSQNWRLQGLGTRRGFRSEAPLTEVLVGETSGFSVELQPREREVVGLA